MCLGSGRAATLRNSREDVCDFPICSGQGCAARKNRAVGGRGPANGCSWLMRSTIAPSLGLTAAWRQYRHWCVADMKSLAGHDVASKGVDERLQRPRHHANLRRPFSVVLEMEVLHQVRIAMTEEYIELSRAYAEKRRTVLGNTRTRSPFAQHVVAVAVER